MPKMEKARIMDAREMARAILRISHEIVEKNQGCGNIRLVGIRKRGVPLAARIAKNIRKIEGCDVPVGILDITFYRDDLRINPHPVVQGTEINFDINDLDVVLVDDVLYTGRTIRAALDALMDFGRPRTIQLAILVDRGHRELPIRPDYVGRNVPSLTKERVRVHLEEIDGEDEVVITE
jgi:pyrimidine operon attenuation protein/uracil phosphoribosyltransferase